MSIKSQIEAKKKELADLKAQLDNEYITDDIKSILKEEISAIESELKKLEKDEKPPKKDEKKEKKADDDKKKADKKKAAPSKEKEKSYIYKIETVSTIEHYQVKASTRAEADKKNTKGGEFVKVEGKGRPIKLGIQKKKRKEKGRPPLKDKVEQKKLFRYVYEREFKENGKDMVEVYVIKAETKEEAEKQNNSRKEKGKFKKAIVGRGRSPKEGKFAKEDGKKAPTTKKAKTDLKPKRGEVVYKDKIYKQNSKEFCDALLADWEKRRKTAKENRNKRLKKKTAPVMKQVVTPISVGVTKAVKKVVTTQRTEINKNPDEYVKKLEKLETSYKAFLKNFKDVLGKDYKATEIEASTKGIEEIITKLKKDAAEKKKKDKKKAKK